jgi:molecular chaperone DnaK (HSP70)
MVQKGVRDQRVEFILRKLIEQAVQDLGAAELNNIVLTVPPAWTSEHCKLLQAAVNPIVETKVRFIHEPIALLISAMYLAPKHTKDFSIVTKLDNADLILVCDWGAGTVDVALVQIKKDGLRHEFSCIGELTELGQGGTAIAEDVIREREKSKKSVLENSTEKMAFRLQDHWQGNSYPGLDFSDCDSITRDRRHDAAKVI